MIVVKKSLTDLALSFRSFARPLIFTVLCAMSGAAEEVILRGSAVHTGMLDQAASN